ncbi:hypothetical protein VOLCADRAFT_90290 [Volvox carteri f. nagariensis]|uniref:Uncharacterized protein n=1 Tax=Volvox carteri f. nagariensis TaxID=3068 RepID=D8TTZ5_VOLCA|nr:uncharacterized protein VOLCADRAFT_90290 [Volvox carteri f. nagariensis]EFJ49052.1 hypothetical protein VOLCADRAFT_90290 [Volvox carteri f. nagariensis]|eukprot:XP_002949949.1 hypothetical protein VOLCADRAFT_90290 [Volvox carteri f. nagariensis]
MKQRQEHQRQQQQLQNWLLQQQQQHAQPNGPRDRGPVYQSRHRHHTELDSDEDEDDEEGELTADRVLEEDDEPGCKAGRADEASPERPWRGEAASASDLGNLTADEKAVQQQTHGSEHVQPASWAGRQLTSISSGLCNGSGRGENSHRGPVAGGGGCHDGASAAIGARKVGFAGRFKAYGDGARGPMERRLPVPKVTPDAVVAWQEHDEKADAGGLSGHSGDDDEGWDAEEGVGPSRRRTAAAAVAAAAATAAGVGTKRTWMESSVGNGGGSGLGADGTGEAEESHLQQQLLQWEAAMNATRPTPLVLRHLAEELQVYHSRSVAVAAVAAVASTADMQKPRGYPGRMVC